LRFGSLCRDLTARSCAGIEDQNEREEARLQRVWAGMDIGRGYHVAVIDAEGSRMLSQRVANDEPALVELIGLIFPR
jgi:hypothetical protein